MRLEQQKSYICPVIFFLQCIENRCLWTSVYGNWCLTVYGKERLCVFDGFYYCYECHENSEHSIPAYIVFNWDFRLYQGVLAAVSLAAVLQFMIFSKIIYSILFILNVDAIVPLAWRDKIREAKLCFVWFKIPHDHNTASAFLICFINTSSPVCWIDWSLLCCHTSLCLFVINVVRLSFWFFCNRCGQFSGLLCRGVYSYCIVLWFLLLYTH